ncbi:MAG: MBL fold metallo-hydrolase [Candidatus Sericytochromatia bacterium]|nr:MBL fold metallo-hydrolase [Candidatus Sericytochromatia bacterium]
MERVRGQTYWMPTGSCNIGIFMIGSKSCVLIDAGGTTEEAEAILATLAEKNIKPEALLITHVHGDNAGGAAHLRKRADLKVYAPVNEKLFLENPKAAKHLSQGGPIGEEATFKGFTPCLCAGVIKPGTDWVASNGKTFTILDMAGHSPGQVGIVTPDLVCFCGDAIASLQDLKYCFIPVFSDLPKGKDTLRFLGKSPYSIFVPTHGPIYDFSINDEVNLNLAQLALLERNVFLHLGQPLTLDELVAYVMTSFGLPDSVAVMYRLNTCLPTYLSELVKSQRIKSVLEGGKTRYFYTE